MKSDWQLVLSPVRFIYARFWQRAHWMLAGIMLVVLFASLGNVAVPYVFSRLIDSLENPDLRVIIMLMFIVYAVMRGLTNALSYAINFMSYIAAQNLSYIAATAFFERLVRKTVGFFIEYNPVEIQTARDKGEQAINVVIQLGIIVVIPGLLQIMLSLFLLGAVINIEIVGIVLVYGVGFISATYFTNKWTRPFLDEAIEAAQENARFMGSALNAMETLRYFNGDSWISQTFRKKAEQVRAALGSWALRRIGFAAVFGAALAAQLALTFVILIPRYYTGELSIGDVVLINTLLIQLNQPFETIGNAIDDLMRSWSGFLPFARMWNAPEEPDVGSTDQVLQFKPACLAFEGVSFHYREMPAVQDISFVVERGRINFLVGETGAGKTTIFKLALKSLEPSAGRITIDGVDIASIPRAQWYANIAVVPQEILLLNDTIANNIVLGRPVDRERLRVVTQKASIASFIAELPEKFDTMVGERGLKLSGGERQRVAIARALYAEPKILFLDEASSALDEVTEAEIMGELRNLCDDVTIFAITHRKGLIKKTDNVLSLNVHKKPPAAS